MMHKLTTMTQTDFVELVKRMRKCQGTYFRTRLPGDLRDSKTAEHEVDKAIKEIEHPEINQPKLF